MRKNGHCVLSGRESRNSKIGDHRIGDHRIGDHRIGDHRIGDHRIGNRRFSRIFLKISGIFQDFS